MPEILIIGGGIAGLILALECQSIGRECMVFEAASQIVPLGVGINLQPSAVRELERLELLPELSRLSKQPSRCIYASGLGQILFEEPLGLAACHQQPQLSIHRANLHKVLIDAALLRLGFSNIALGQTCIGYSQSTGGVCAHFLDGTSVAGKILIACDGIHSRIFRQMHPARQPIHPSQITMWRGVSPGVHMLDGCTMLRAGTVDNGKLVAYPIPSPNSGPTMLNWVVEKQISPNENSASGLPTANEVKCIFRHWDEPWLDPECLFNRSSTIMSMPMTDRDPCPYWTDGRVTLLGDAAHPMYPIGSNGAGQAILDAAVLARCLAESSDDMEALRSYERIRRPVADRIVLADRAGGPDVVLAAIEAKSQGLRVPEGEIGELKAQAASLLAEYRQRVEARD
jgi:2-polyprenyl-6-methoxyphenol hydroxylase-like FAD-dependent oxidoreductase